MQIEQFTVTPEYLASQGLSQDFPERFWKKVNKQGPIPNHAPELGPCWIWTASVRNFGYGQISRGTKSGMEYAHRASYIICVDKTMKGRGAKGETHGLHKLTLDQVMEIRRLFSHGVPQKEIAKQFGSSRANICLIVNRLAWPHVA